MISNYKCCVLLVLLSVCHIAYKTHQNQVQARSISSNSTIRGRNRHHRRLPNNDTTGSIICRMTIEEQINIVHQQKNRYLKNENEQFERTEQTSCIPIIYDDDKIEIETDEILPIILPDVIQIEYGKELRRGILYVQVSNVILLRNEHTKSISKIVSNRFTQYTVYKVVELLSPFVSTTSRTGPSIGFVSGEGDSVQDGISTYLATKPIISVLFVRISAPDSQMNYTAHEIVDHNLNPSKVNFKTQYSACSQRQLQIEPATFSNGIIEVMLSKSITQYTSGGDIVEDATNQLKIREGIAQINTLADRVVFCAPPGTDGWMASAGVRHWRIQMNNDWCLSLTGLMHEFGHTFGLLHSHANDDPYGDRTGYMGSGSTIQEWPRKCFNGYNTFLFQWYSSKHYSISDVTTNGPTSAINLVAFVDNEFIANNSSESPSYVIINIDDVYFLQYNRAKSFNIDTEQHQDKVTITQAVETGSETIGAITFGEYFEISNYKNTQQSLRIEICSGGPITLYETTIDMMKVSITMGDKEKSFCNTILPTTAPVKIGPSSNPVSIIPTPPPVTAAPISSPTTGPPVLVSMPLSPSLFKQPNPIQQRRPSSSLQPVPTPTFAPISGGTVVVLPPSVILDSNRDSIEESRDKKRRDFMQQLFTILVSNDGTDENNP
jgi:Gametolysin peptidase M11